MNTVIRKIGNSEGIIIPKEILNALNLRSGDELVVVKEGNGLRIVPKDTDLAKQIKAAREGMKQYHSALRELAK
jgi:putative addiction module antidote